MKNSNARVQTLSPGHALIVVTEGEVTVQRPAEWLGDTVVMHAPLRITAPAAIEIDSAATVVPNGRAKFSIEEAPGVMASLLSWLRGTSAPAMRAA